MVGATRIGSFCAMTSLVLACRFQEPPVSIDEIDLALNLHGSCVSDTPIGGCPCLGAVASEDGCGVLVDGWIDPARAAGLTYSKACVDGLFERLSDFERGEWDQCSSDRAHNLSWLACEDECQIYHGTATVDEPCERFGRRMSTCAAELACGFDNRCHAPCDLPLEIPEGSACGYRVGLLHEQCTDGLVCDAATSTCVIAPMTGASCEPDSPVCASPDGCAPETMTCAPRQPVGAACTAEQDCVSSVCDVTCLEPDPYRCGNQYF